MIPFIIAGAVGFGIAKLLEKDNTKKYAEGGQAGEDLENYSNYDEFYNVVFDYIKREENLTEEETKDICIVNESIIEAEFDGGSSPRFTGDVILGYLSNERGYMSKGGGVDKMDKFISELAKKNTKEFSVNEYHYFRNKKYAIGVARHYFTDNDGSFSKFDTKLGDALNIDFETQGDSNKYASGGKTGKIKDGDSVIMYFNQDTELEIFESEDLEEEPYIDVFKKGEKFEVDIFGVDDTIYDVQFGDGDVAFIPKNNVTIVSVNDKTFASGGEAGEKPMNYAQLLKQLKSLTKEQLQQTPTIYIESEDEYYAVSYTDMTNEDDVLDEGHPFLVISDEEGNDEEKPMNYAQLLKGLKVLSKEQLQQTLTIYIERDDEYYAVSHTDLTLEDDVLDEGHFFLVISDNSDEYAEGGEAGEYSEEVEKILENLEPEGVKFEGNSREGFSVLVKDKNSDFSAFVDVYMQGSDVTSEWNQYIFAKNNSKDMLQSDLQDNADIFDYFTSEAINYLEQQGAIQQDDNGDWSYTKKYESGGSVSKGYMVFNYTDNLYATYDVFKTKKLANDFIKEFRNRYSKQGYYRDNQMNKIDIKDIDLLAIPSDFNPLK